MEKQEKGKPKSPEGSSEMGPLSVIMSIFTKPVTAANLFRMVWWSDSVFCPQCKKSDNITKRGKYQTHLQRYRCKKCRKSFNDKTGTILHYKHVGLGQWMMFVWGFFGGLPKSMSINHLAREIGSYWYLRKRGCYPIDPFYCLNFPQTTCFSKHRS